jgi:phage-related minor tail protein
MEGARDAAKTLRDTGKAYGDTSRAQLEAARLAAEAQMREQQLLDDTIRERARAQQVIQASADAYHSLRASLDPTIAAQQEYQRSMELLNEALRMNPELASTAAETAVMIGERYAEAMGQAKNATDSLAENVQQNLQGAFGSWIDSAVEGTSRLRDVLRELAQDVAKLALKFAANQLFGSLLGGGGGGLGGLLDSLFAKGAAFSQLALPQGVYTQPTFFQMPGEGPLQRYASGGVLGEAGAEAVLPLRRLPNGRLGVEGMGGGTEVVINNYTGEAVSRRTRQLGDREIVEIAIGQMEERVVRGGNSTSRSMQQAFGLRRGR